MTNPIFILGAQRSGTTLLRLLLNSHSLIAIPEEAAFLMPLLKKGNVVKGFNTAEICHLHRYLANDQHFELWNYDHTSFLEWLRNKSGVSLSDFIDQLYSSYANSENKIIWGDKTPSLFRRINILSDVFPDARFIHVVRDGRDIFCSIRKMIPSRNNALLMALDWKYKTKKIEDFFKRKKGLSYMTVRYEDLVGNPGDTLLKISNFLEIDFEEGMMDFHKTSSQYIGEHHSDKIFSPITKSSCKKWIHELQTQEINVFDFVAGKELVEYGYPVTRKKGLSFSEILNIFASLLTVIPKRIYQVISVQLGQEVALRQGRGANYLAVGKAAIPKRKPSLAKKE